MNILEICSASKIGGGEVHVAQLVAAMRRRGHRVSLVGRQESPLECDRTLKFGPTGALGAIYRLRQVVREGDFDIVHAHLARDYPIASAALLADKACRLVLTRHLAHRVRRTPLYRRVDGWIAATPQIAGTLAHLRPRRLEVIPNWVDQTRFPYRDAAFHDPVRIGLLGEIAPHKGHDEAIRMLRNLGSGFRLLVAGTGEDAYVSALGERTRDLPVAFPGFVDAAEFLGRIDILILPSWEEPFGIVLLEAMASGVNVIATEAGGPPEILDHGQAGLLVPPRSPEALAAAIRHLATDPDLAARLRRAAHERVRQHYEISRVVPRMEAYLDEIVNHPDPAA
jgi:glycosyltransferase involved in cell wall biosynthesis